MIPLSLSQFQNVSSQELEGARSLLERRQPSVGDGSWWALLGGLECERANLNRGTKVSTIEADRLWFLPCYHLLASISFQFTRIECVITQDLTGPGWAREGGVKEGWVYYIE
jgi:hypothetical protein